ncbi:hypothetical protein [Actinacidiphila bryophytorum]|uniref:hypothetical protein n=1 Tax=Actinacidiphila bryophytorum TaxID=1436133 RepID=UPI00195FB8FE|nr:hypothetical protein [Actinacidiphila bryophytorum]MBM9434405.1 hypothetical protein [Actinacidiphila bryophytorum]MBN6543329.1 hypothetical protein [Actinacidiphila bryophytorum]
MTSAPRTPGTQCGPELLPAGLARPRRADAQGRYGDRPQGVPGRHHGGRLLWELAVNLPLYQRPAIEGTKSTLANYGDFGFQDTDWTKIGFTG